VTDERIRTVGAALLVTLREGLEAALIISILLAYLKQLERYDGSRKVWAGTVSAIVVSIVVGWVIFAVGAKFEGRAEEIFEGLVSLAAVVVLTWMVFFMRKAGSSIRSELQERVDSALKGGGVALGLLAFTVVLREGIETALFLFGTDQVTGESKAATLVGGLLGLGIAVALGYLIYQGGIHLNLRVFFKVTGALLLVVAAGLLAFSVHELQEAHVLPGDESKAFDSSSILPSDPDESIIGGMLRALVGYHDNPSVLEVVAWAGYLLIAGFFFFRPERRPRTVATAAEG
jgi:high-affinity iron transporter